MRYSTHFVGCLSLGVALLGAAAGTSRAGEPWKYVVPEPGDRYEHGPLRATALSEEKPSDVREEVQYRGSHRRYAQLRYGSPNSTRVTIVVDDLPSGEVDLYVDSDRDRKIQPSERIVGKDRRWRLPLESAWIEEGNPTPDYQQGTVILQLSRSGRTLSFATAGFMEGSVRLASGDVRARRLDGDGNGAFADPDDRLWVDLDGNGQWDRFSEQFPCRPIMKLGENRYAVRTDRRGESFSLEELTGTATVEIRVKPKKEAGRVKEFQGLLIGRDGSAMGLAEAGEKTTLPINEYRFDSLTLVLEDPEGKAPWSYSLSSANGAERKWHMLKANDAITIEPIRDIQFLIDLGSNGTKFRPGETINVTPHISSAEGLQTNIVWRGDRTNYSRDYVNAELRVLAPDGKLLGSARSGFG